MELPRALRNAVDRALAGVPLRDLSRASEILSQRFRAETRDGRLHLSDDMAARAYLAARMPATYAAVRTVLNHITQMRPDFAPRTALDVGAGPGSALWAAVESWPTLEDAVLAEASAAIRAWGEKLTAETGLLRIEWRADDIRSHLPDLAPRDLVTMAYVLGELAPDVREGTVVRLWAATADMLVIVEPGTPAGWTRILSARDQLIAAGAHLVAPCPHTAACPLSPPDWCHFSRRVARSRMHRRAKTAEVPWEDEKFSYIAASRRPGVMPPARVLAAPRLAHGQVRLKLCEGDGTVAERNLSRRHGAAYKHARRLDWGDAFEPTE